MRLLWTIFVLVGTICGGTIVIIMWIDVIIRGSKAYGVGWAMAKISRKWQLILAILFICISIVGIVSTIW
jgi:hypothetical protein